MFRKVRRLRDPLRERPLFVRAAPFVIFLGLTFFQLAPGEATPYWAYLGKTLVGGFLIWLTLPLVRELKWRMGWEGIVGGVAVFGLWVGLEGRYPVFQESGTAWNPFAVFGAGSMSAWAFIGVRIAGSTLLVPMLEEVFYRSFLYRWIADPDFEKVDLGEFRWRPFLVASAVFGLAHREWLAGMLTGALLQWLALRRRDLGDALTAHAVANLLLGIWVVWRGQWIFWS